MSPNRISHDESDPGIGNSIFCVGRARQIPPKPAKPKSALYQTNPSGFRDRKNALMDSTPNQSAPYVAAPPRRKS